MIADMKSQQRRSLMMRLFYKMGNILERDADVTKLKLDMTVTDDVARTKYFYVDVQLPRGK